MHEWACPVPGVAPPRPRHSGAAAWSLAALPPHQGLMDPPCTSHLAPGPTLQPPVPLRILKTSSQAFLRRRSLENSSFGCSPQQSEREHIPTIPGLRSRDCGPEANSPTRAGPLSQVLHRFLPTRSHQTLPLPQASFSGPEDSAQVGDTPAQPWWPSPCQTPPARHRQRGGREEPQLSRPSLKPFWDQLCLSSPAGWHLPCLRTSLPWLQGLGTESSVGFQGPALLTARSRVQVWCASCLLPRRSPALGLNQHQGLEAGFPGFTSFLGPDARELAPSLTLHSCVVCLTQGVSGCPTAIPPHAPATDHAARCRPLPRTRCTQPSLGWPGAERPLSS